MKRSALIFFALALIAVPFASAVQISMNSNFSQGETLFAQISGNFLDAVQQQNILLYEGHLRIPFIPSVNKENGIFYVYGQLQGKDPGNYSLVLTGVRYMESGTVKSDDVSKNFTITNASADLSVDPGFISANVDSSFFIKVLNLRDSSITVNYYLQNSSGIQSVDVSPGPEKQVSFSTSGFSNGSYSAILSSGNTSYSVPVFLTGISSTPAIPGNESTNVTWKPLQLQSSGFNISMSTNATTSRYIYVSNPSDNSTNISLSVSNLIRPYVSVPNVTTISPNSNSSIQFNITSLGNSSLIYGSINATFENSSVLIPVMLNFSANYSESPQGNSSQSLFQSCVQLGGIKCLDNQTCSGETKNAEDGQCCLGTCTASKNGNSKKIFGWTLAAIALAGIILFFVFRYKKAKRPFSLMNAARRK